MPFFCLVTKVPSIDARELWMEDLEAEKSLVFSVSLAEKTLLKGTILLSSTSFDDKNPTSVGCILQCMEKTPSFYERFTF